MTTRENETKIQKIKNIVELNNNNKKEKIQGTYVQIIDELKNRK